VNPNILEAYTHLCVALKQVLPTDDEIIVEHIRRAHELLHDELFGKRGDAGCATS
jgi:hypothetical protein